jgi:hypothetical protein
VALNCEVVWRLVLIENVEGSNGQVYFGERSVAGDYQGLGSYAPGMIRYDMHSSFLEKFDKSPK